MHPDSASRHPPRAAAADAPAPSPGEIRLTIARDPYTSSDHVTLCRVRAVNAGSRSWSGKSLRFEARAVDSGAVVRERGRFGLELAPYGSLETLIALPGTARSARGRAALGAAPGRRGEQAANARNARSLRGLADGPRLYNAAA